MLACSYFIKALETGDIFESFKGSAEMEAAGKAVDVIYHLSENCTTKVGGVNTTEYTYVLKLDNL